MSTYRVGPGEDCDYPGMPELLDRVRELEQDNARLRCARRNQLGDDLCWIVSEGEAKALPEAEFLESCRRFRNQIASERGEFTGGRTIAQLEAQVERLIEILDNQSQQREVAESRLAALIRAGGPLLAWPDGNEPSLPERLAAFTVALERARRPT